MPQEDFLGESFKQPQPWLTLVIAKETALTKGAIIALQFQEMAKVHAASKVFLALELQEMSVAMMSQASE